jgi:hypothetical protein
MSALDETKDFQRNSVTPAEAGVQGLPRAKAGGRATVGALALDSGFRRNDGPESAACTRT